MNDRCPRNARKWLQVKLKFVEERSSAIRVAICFGVYDERYCVDSMKNELRVSRLKLDNSHSDQDTRNIYKTNNLTINDIAMSLSI